MSCLSNENLAALVGGSADAEQLSTWKAHISKCDTCATRFARKQVGLSPSELVSDPSADPDATITVKPNLDAGAAGAPSDAIPGYLILKELHRGGQGVVYQAIQDPLRHEGTVKADEEASAWSARTTRLRKLENGKNGWLE